MSRTRPGVLLSTENLDRIIELGERSVTLEAGIRYGELGVRLLEHGLAVPNYASLPHISVGGAIATATHGSGRREPVARLAGLGARPRARRRLAPDVSPRRGRFRRRGRRARRARGGRAGDARRRAGVRAPAGRLRTAAVERRRGEPRRDPCRRLQRQSLHDLDRRRRRAGVGQVARRPGYRVLRCDAAATKPLNPVPGSDPENCTDQLGVPGPSGDRLPHFRLGFTPSGGDELQTEYIVPREHAEAAIRELRRLGATDHAAAPDRRDPGDRRRHVLAQHVLRARQRLRSTSPGSRSRPRCSPCCRRSRRRWRRSSRGRTGARCSSARRPSGTRSCRRFERSASDSIPTGTFGNAFLTQLGM